MNNNGLIIPIKTKIESDNIPIEWLQTLAIKEGNSKKPIYQIHKWWARRLGNIFRAIILLSVAPESQTNEEFIDDFYAKHNYHNLTILDPFMGGGTSIVEASKLNAKVIGIDIDPVAWFVTRKEVEPFPRKDIDIAMKSIEEKITERIKSYYITKVQDKYYPVIYFFWVDEVTCPNCQCMFECHPHYILTRNSKLKQKTVFCKKCHRIATISEEINNYYCSDCKIDTEVEHGPLSHGIVVCPECNNKMAVLSIIDPQKPLRKKMFAVEYEEESTSGVFHRKYKPADNFDFSLFDQIVNEFESINDMLIYPKTKIPSQGRNDPRPINYGYKYYYQLFNARQLLSLSLLYSEILSIEESKVREFLMLAFSDSLASNNMLCRYAFGYNKLTPLFGLHAYDVVSRSVENNVWGTNLGRGSFSKCVNKLIRGKKYSERPYESFYERGKLKKCFTGEKITREVTTNNGQSMKFDTDCLLLRQSSTDLDCLKEQSIDLILTDPPFYNNLSYSELSDFYYAWLKAVIQSQGEDLLVSTPYQEALFVKSNGNVDQSKTRYESDLTKVLQNARRLLKSEGLLVFTFHHRSMEAWLSLSTALWRADFNVSNVFPIQSEGKSGFHSTDGTIKWDCVIVCRPIINKKDSIFSLEKVKQNVINQRVLWGQRLSLPGSQFQWADLLSLSYGIGLKETVNLANCEENIKSAFKDLRPILISFLNERQVHLLNKE